MNRINLFNKMKPWLKGSVIGFVVGLIGAITISLLQTMLSVPAILNFILLLPYYIPYLISYFIIKFLPWQLSIILLYTLFGIFVGYVYQRIYKKNKIFARKIIFFIVMCVLLFNGGLMLWFTMFPILN